VSLTETGGQGQVEPGAPRRELLLVTGMSGAGRSTVGNALEDLGWYVVDNLPPQMLRPLIDLSRHTGDTIPRVAAVVGIRGGKLEQAQLGRLDPPEIRDVNRLWFAFK